MSVIPVQVKQDKWSGPDPLPCWVAHRPTHPDVPFGYGHTPDEATEMFMRTAKMMDLTPNDVWFRFFVEPETAPTAYSETAP